MYPVNLRPTLDGRIVRLEPLEERHEGGIRAAADDERIWTWMWTNDLDHWVADTLSREGLYPFVVLRDGAVVGSTSYLSLVPEHRRIEIGNTWNNPSTWGSGVNTEAKYLLMRHAFEELGLQRVEFKTDALNDKSRNALKRIGASEEGILRKHMVTFTGRVRDSVYYSVIDSEWPRVKQHLEGLMARYGTQAA